MPAVFKAIKPSTLRIDAFRLEALNSMRKIGRKIKKDFEKTTKTWDSKPTFTMKISLKAPGPTTEVTTDDEIYKGVDEGTDPHIIVPVNATKLVFLVGGTPKTTPNVIDSKPGSPGDQLIFTDIVDHPGTEARNFSKTIAEKWESPFKKEMEAALQRARKKSGHAI